MGADIIFASKERDTKTGEILATRCDLPAHYGMVTQKDFLIVDDICDGGGTFNLLAEAFSGNEFGAQSELELFVSHGIFSKGLGAVSDRYRRITTTDSWCRPQASDRLTILPLLPLLANNTEVAL